jgi:hypothetical protein
MSAVSTRRPVFVTDVARSPLFVDEPTREIALAAGARAVYAYPLPDLRGGVAAVLSFHHGCRAPEPAPSAIIARHAALALRSLA